MIVEDSPSTIKLYKDQAKDHYDIDFFEDARTALNHYKNTKYDLVITDLMLPLKSGEGLIFDIKYVNPYQKIAVISGSPGYLKLKEYDNIHVFEKPIKICNVINFVLLGQALSQTSDDANSRRKHPRYPVKLGANILIPDQSEKMSLYIKNVSLGGVFIEGNLPILIQNDILPIELPLLDQILKLKIKKCWEKEGFGIGAKFHNIGHSEYSLLELFLESLRAGQ